MSANKKISFIIFTAILLLVSYVVFIQAPANSSEQEKLVLAHNLDTKHPVHLAMEYMAEMVSDKTQGQVEIKIYANGQLGREREVIELLQLGVVAMTKVSAMSLESFSPLYSVLNIPYMFRDREHFYKVLDGEVGKEILESGRKNQFFGLTYFDGGARSFYASKPILKPEDLKGLKIRVMGSQTALRMMKLLGGSAAPMPYGEVYTGIQQGVIDGAENNPTALTLSRHGEVAKHYSLSEHMRIPDVLIISEKSWSRLSESAQNAILESARQASRYQRELWIEVAESAMKEAQEKLGVNFHKPDKTLFFSRVTEMHDDIKKQNPDFKRLIERIQSN